MNIDQMIQNNDWAAAINSWLGPNTTTLAEIQRTVKVYREAHPQLRGNLVATPWFRQGEMQQNQRRFSIGSDSDEYSAVNVTLWCLHDGTPQARAELITHNPRFCTNSVECTCDDEGECDNCEYGSDWCAYHEQYHN